MMLNTSLLDGSSFANDNFSFRTLFTMIAVFPNHMVSIYNQIFYWLHSSSLKRVFHVQAEEILLITFFVVSIQTLML